MITDYSLYLVTDRKLSLGRSNLEVIEAALEGGITLVQLREKELGTREFYHEAKKIRELLRGRQIPLIINDRIDIALAVDADGVHIGQKDMPLDLARKILGPDKIIGVSVFTIDEAKSAETGGADYLGLSPIFVTSTKPELNKQIGIEGIRPINQAVKIPLVGIGAMNANNTFEAVRAGLDGVAVVSGIVSQNDIAAAARAIKAEVLRAKKVIQPCAGKIMKVNDIGEFGFIDRIKSGCLIRETDVIKAIGDDCCVFRNSGRLASLLTTDMLVENVHFLRDTIPSFKLGRKAIAVNISDIAAMGGIPKEAVISIAIPDTIDVEYLDALYDGMKAMAREFDVNLLGGNTTSEPEHLVINIALIGEEAEDEVLYRSGAKIGDIVFLTGQVGSSAAGLDILLHKRPVDTFKALLDAHFDPHPQIAEGRIIARSKLAHSLIDVSDGVASDLGHICDESKVGAVINEDKIPVSEIFSRYLVKYDLDFERLSLHVGEDYILLGTAPEGSHEALGKALRAGGCQFFVIGEITSEPGIRIIGRSGQTRQIRSSGFDHFRREER